MIVCLDTYYIVSTYLFIEVFNDVVFSMRSFRVEAILFTIGCPIFSKQQFLASKKHSIASGKERKSERRKEQSS